MKLKFPQYLSQCNIWDAQKDILADTLDAISASTLFAFMYKKDIRGLIKNVA